jgi:hypothetical protein
MRTITVSALAIVSLSMFVSAQPQSEAAQREQQLSARVGSLIDRLNYRDEDRADKDRYYDELDDVTRQINQGVDEYVRGVLTATDSTEQIEARLVKLLRRQPNPLYGDGVLARKADLRGGKSLLLAYTVVRPPHHDRATIRGYMETADGYQLRAQAGDDFDGFNMFKRELRSPLLGEIWLMAWGQSHTGNGKIVRFRMYAFDGDTFRTIWSPDDMFDAEVRFTDTGFAVDHYRRPLQIHDEYSLTPNGPLKTLP